MKITTSKDTDPVTDMVTYRLAATIDGERYSVSHTVCGGTWNLDNSQLIESALWRQLMNTIEQRLRKIAYEHRP